MATIICKQCGCPNQVTEEQVTFTCEACDTEQTLPKIDSDRKIYLFNRANEARIDCDFETSRTLFEQILTEFPDDSESHWCLLLCKYGIEYVDDPKTKKKVPTCHRTIFNSILDDNNYKETIKYADVVAKRLYQKEAEAIDKIQKNIIAISQKETPYDIFICYKETDENNERTKDSVEAEKIYNELTNKGYKVFFSRITLESKLGMQYEPIIFAALQSSKVMLVIGSKKEYFNAVWVKNEWSRFLSFMQESNTTKYFIPCYRDMKAYDMPKEFQPFQAQDLTKIGFLQDLSRGIDKLFDKEKIVSSQTTKHVNNSLSNMLKRASVLIEDNEFDKAYKLIEQIFLEDSENFAAYFLLFLIDNKFANAKDYINNTTNNYIIEKNLNRAISYANDKNKEILNSYRNLHNYNKAKYFEEKGYIFSAIKSYESLGNYKDSKENYVKCINYIVEKYNSKINCLLEINELEKLDNIYANAGHIIRELEEGEDNKKISELIIQLENKIDKHVYDICYKKIKSIFPINSYDDIKNNNDVIIKIRKLLEENFDYTDSEVLLDKLNEGINNYINQMNKKVYDYNVNILDRLIAKKPKNFIKYDECVNALYKIRNYSDTNEKIKYYETKKEDILFKSFINKRRKKVIALVSWTLILLILFILFYVQKKGCDIDYSYSDSVYTLYGYNGDEKEVTIPHYIDIISSHL